MLGYAAHAADPVVRYLRHGDRVRDDKHVVPAQVPVDDSVSVEEHQCQHHVVEEAHLLVVGEGVVPLLQVDGEVVVTELHEQHGELRVCIDVSPQVLDEVGVAYAAEGLNLVLEGGDETPLYPPLSPLAPPAAPGAVALALKQLRSHVLPSTEEVVAVGLVGVAIVARTQRVTVVQNNLLKL